MTSAEADAQNRPRGFDPRVDPDASRVDDDLYSDLAIGQLYRVLAIPEVYRENTIGGDMANYSARLRAPADFGRALQQARVARGLSQTDLARELGIPQSTVSEMESGKSTIYLRRLLTFARATGVEFTATWGDHGEPRN
jgi:DNA-binding XRE family transcriptional regulator